MATSIAGGWLSDKIGKRKTLVISSALIIMAGLIVIATSGTTDQVLWGQAIVGLGLGCFGAVDVALIADLLPRRRAKMPRLSASSTSRRPCPSPSYPPSPSR